MNEHVSLSVIHTICHINTLSHCMTTVVKMVGRSVNQKDDIRAYIKALLKHGCSLKQLTTELSNTYGHSSVSYDTFRRLKINLNLM